MTDVIVIGGGIVGTAAASFLAEAGASVTLFDRTGLASGASGANSGVVQHPLDAAMVPLYSETVELYRALTAADAGFTLPARPAGMLFVSHEPAAVDGIANLFPDLATEVVAGAALQALEPTAAPDLTACYVPIAFPVPPSASTYAYATVAERRGVTIRQGKAAMPVVREGRVVGVRVGGEVILADQVLVAAGPWSPELIDPTGAWRPIRPLWGVVVEIELAKPPRMVLEEAEIDGRIGAESHIGEEAASDFSLITALGVSAVGSTFLDDEPDPETWIVPLLSRAETFVRGVATAPIRGVRACARPLSADRRPLIGPVPEVAGLFICAGHGPWGISTGPASARLVTDLMLGRPTAIPVELDAARFGAPSFGSPLSA